jgi:hypothetical protein
MVFRRRPPIGQRPVGRRIHPLRRAAIRQLRIANQMYDQGQWAQAAEQFECLASAAIEHTFPQAPQLFLRAGRARIAAGESEIGIGHLHQAVHLLGQFGQIRRLNLLRPRLIRELKEYGFEREAVELDQAIHKVLDQYGPPDGEIEPAGPANRLPGKCPSCGGTLRPDEIEWIDACSGVCSYCGSVVQAG